MYQWIYFYLRIPSDYVKLKHSDNVQFYQKQGTTDTILFHQINLNLLSKKIILDLGIILYSSHSESGLN